MATLSGSYRNTLGSLFRLKNNSTLNVSFLESITSGEGYPVFVAESGSVLNLTNIGEINSSNAPVVVATNSKVNVSNVAQMQAVNAFAVKATDSSLIVSNLNTLKGSIPVYLRGECHVNLNRVNSIVSYDGVSVSGDGTSHGSVLLQNLPTIGGCVQTTNMNLTLLNVRGIRSDDGRAALDFRSSGADGNYLLKVDGPTDLLGSNALLIVNGVADLHGVVVQEGTTNITNSVVSVGNSVFVGDLTVNSSTLNGTRTSFGTVTPTDSHINSTNCTIEALLPDSSSVISYHSAISGDVSSTNKSAIWLHNSKLSGATTLSSGSSMIGSAANISGAVTATASFFGSYGGAYGTVTTASKGMALAFGSSSGSIDGLGSSSNVMSAMTDALDIYADVIRITSAKDMTLTTEAGNLKLDVHGNYSNTVTDSYTDAITGATVIGVNSSYTVQATQDVRITGATVTIIGTPVTI